MKGYIIDASVALKWFIPESYPDVALHDSRVQAPPSRAGFYPVEVGQRFSQKDPTQRTHEGRR